MGFRSVRRLSIFNCSVDVPSFSTFEDILINVFPKMKIVAAETNAMNTMRALSNPIGPSERSVFSKNTMQTIIAVGTNDHQMFNVFKCAFLNGLQDTTKNVYVIINAYKINNRVLTLVDRVKKSIQMTIDAFLKISTSSQ